MAAPRARVQPSSNAASGEGKMTSSDGNGPPKRAPFFFDFMSGKEHTFPDTAGEMAATIERIASEARHFTEWKIDDGPLAGLPISLNVIEYSYGQRAVIRAETSHGAAILSIAPDPSGWVRIDASWNGVDAFTCYLDHGYEQYGFWPPGATPAPHEEEPGRFGKKLAWVGLDTAKWPVLAPLANEFGGLTLCEKDQQIIVLPETSPLSNG
jgi:hypothetical protein